MAVTFTNILVGEATLSVDGTDIGATQDGVGISWEPDMVDIEIDQFGDAARVVQSRVKVMVKTTLAEGTLENLAISWGYTTGVAADEPGLTVAGLEFNLGLHGVYPEEHTIVFVGNAPGSTATTTKTRTYSCNRAIQYSSSEHSLQRAENVKLPVEFRILPNTSLTGKEYGTIIDQA
jgi:hypothetical protein